jgi:selenocysteine lyase/cysteine desulfurase
MAHSLGIEVIVDAAHSFAQIPFTISELGCDYLGASLHKWLGAPLGTGLLYVRKEKIEKVWPFFGDTRLPQNDIRKLQHFGNCPDSAHLGLREAIRWHNVIGAETKIARLRFLQHRWSDVARELNGIRMFTPPDSLRSGAISSFIIEGVEPRQLAEYFMKEHRIFIAAFEHPLAKCVRVTPGLPTSKADIDNFIIALKASVRNFI